MRKLQRILVFPAWSDNPYLNLMSLAPRAAGFEFKGVTTSRSLFDASSLLDAGDVLHLHWTAPILQREPTLEAAAAALESFRTLLAEMKARGVRLIWTIHNQLPHEVPYREAEISLYRLLATSADAIHIMSPQTPTVLKDICELPADRLVEIPHPSYVGVYGSPMSRVDARASFDLADDEPTVLFLGQMRPYKGLGVLLAALSRLAEEGKRTPTVLLAGAATPEVQAEIEEALPEGVRVIPRYEFVPDAEVGQWFAAADLAVFPYQAILNSGSLHLSASFGVPAVLPGEAHLVEQFSDEPWVGFFDPEDAVPSLASLLESIPEARDHVARIEDFNAAITPWRVSEQYAALLRDLVAR
ncbi:MAG: glycosyltransferase [Microbacterium sp.]